LSLSIGGSASRSTQAGSRPTELQERGTEQDQKYYMSINRIHDHPQASEPAIENSETLSTCWLLHAPAAALAAAIGWQAPINLPLTV
jgi:hypothetical protein